MPRTLSVSNDPPDLDGRVADGLEALRQRIDQRLRFPRGTWPIDLEAGTDRVLGHRSAPRLAVTVITDAVIDEGGDEVQAVRAVDIKLDHESRQLTFTAAVDSIYGTFTATGSVL